MENSLIELGHKSQNTPVHKYVFAWGGGSGAQMSMAIADTVGTKASCIITQAFPGAGFLAHSFIQCLHQWLARGTILFCC